MVFAYLKCHLLLLASRVVAFLDDSDATSLRVGNLIFLFVILSMAGRVSVSRKLKATFFSENNIQKSNVHFHCNNKRRARTTISGLTEIIKYKKIYSGNH